MSISPFPPLTFWHVSDRTQWWSHDMCLPFIMFCRFQDATMQSSKWRRKPGMNFMVRSKICTCRTHTHTETQTRCLFVYIFAFYSNSSLHTLSMIAQRRHPGHRLSRNLQILRLRISILSSWNRAENQAAPPCTGLYNSTRYEYIISNRLSTPWNI